MNIYIFITTSIKVAGGSQCYTAAKAKFLEENGWKVIVFFQGDRVLEHKCLIDYFNKFLGCDVTGISNPPFMYPKWLRNKILNKMLNLIGEYRYSDQIIIESHEDSYSQWGEILASRINARHYVFLMNEHYRGVNSFYEDKIDFYDFKFNRREIEGTQTTYDRLFEGYRTILPEEIHGVRKLDECPIQDYRCEIIDDIQKKDWNICYIGRGNKPYVQNILKDVGTFANKHKSKSIQLLTVGDMDIHRDEINRILLENENLVVRELGYLHPLPLSLYEKVDVVIAGSGSARHSCEEGAIVIVADTETRMSDGILGYETLNSVYKSDDSVCSDFSDALERVFVEKVQLNLPYRFPPKLGVEKQTEQHFELFNMSDRKYEYYDEKKLVEGNRNWKFVVKIAFHNYFPNITSFLINHK